MTNKNKQTRENTKDSNIESTLDALWQTYANINEWIRSSNTKAEIILAINGIMASVFLSSNLATLKIYLTTHTVILIFFILIIISTTTSIITATLCVYPRLNVGAPESLLYFSNIASQFKNAPAYERTVRDKFIDQNQILHDLSSQVWANSVVASQKFKYISWSMGSLATSIGLGVITIGVIIFT